MGRSRKEEGEKPIMKLALDAGEAVNQGVETPVAGMVNQQEEEYSERAEQYNQRKEPAAPKEEEVYNCLRNERVIVRFVSNPNAMVQTKGHVLSGGMADTAERTFVVPILSSTGQFVDVLNKKEKECLERVMGLEYNALSVYKKKDNFWSDANPQGVGRVVLRKQDNYLDLSVPTDYIKYKILLANKDYIASSMQELEDRPKATYQFVIVSENAEARMNLNRVDAMKRSWIEYGKIEDDADTLRVIIEILTGRPIAPQVKLDYLQGKVSELIQKDARRFLGIVQDDLLPYKVLIKKSLEAGLISRRNDLYYYENSPMCEMNEDSTLNNAARWIASIKRQELKYSLEARIKEV